MAQIFLYMGHIYINCNRFNASALPVKLLTGICEIQDSVLYGTMQSLNSLSRPGVIKLLALCGI